MTSNALKLTSIAASEPALAARYRQQRAVTEALCWPLEIEDYCIQTMADVSPPKWHLAHVSWFFETFVLKPYLRGYEEFDPGFGYLFNSYYQTVGNFHPRPQRGLLSRPTVEQVFTYRAHVDTAVQALLAELATDDRPERDEIQRRIELGLHHEQQHQELLITDIKHIFAANPLRPVYHRNAVPPRRAAPPDWREFPAGIYEIGHAGAGFGFDNECPRHKVYLNAFRLATRPVSNADYLAFVEAGGYRRCDLWLAEGWERVASEGWQAPLYWERQADGWHHMTLAGWLPLDADAPVCHLSYYEADAYARWRGRRLPTEAEWEVAAAGVALRGHFAASGYFQPMACADGGLVQMFGDVWEWTQSAYGPYPGYRATRGPLGEYNGKFMCNQMVLRGGSCATPTLHMRASYRNFFHPHDRWQFSGVRLAEDL